LVGAAGARRDRGFSPQSYRAGRGHRLPRLKLITISGLTHRTRDLEAAAARHPSLPHGPAGLRLQRHSRTGLGLILSLTRHLPAEIAGMRQVGWQTRLGSSLAGKTLGLRGLGWRRAWTDRRPRCNHQPARPHSAAGQVGGWPICEQAGTGNTGYCGAFQCTTLRGRIASLLYLQLCFADSLLHYWYA